MFLLFSALTVKMLKTMNTMGIFKNDDIWFPTYYTYNTAWNYSDASESLAKVNFLLKDLSVWNKISIDTRLSIFRTVYAKKCRKYWFKKNLFYDICLLWKVQPQRAEHNWFNFTIYLRDFKTTLKQRHCLK